MTTILGKLYDFSKSTLEYTGEKLYKLKSDADK